MSDDKNIDEVIDDFDQTNGKVQGLEGDSRGFDEDRVNKEGRLDADGEVDPQQPLFDAEGVQGRRDSDEELDD